MIEKATLAAGCFWSVEDAYRQLLGVLSTRVGYCGGSVPAPSYEEVCQGNTGHCEAVEITFNNQQISYEELLTLFWQNHDATIKMKPQYRSAIFYHHSEQQEIAHHWREKWQMSNQKEILTEIVAVPTFYAAEEYHQQYYEKQHQKVLAILAKMKELDI